MSLLLTCIIILTCIIFFGTVFMNHKTPDEKWSKIRLSTNGTHRDGWRREFSNGDVRYYGIDGNPILNLKVIEMKTYEINQLPPIPNEDTELVFVIDNSGLSYNYIDKPVIN